MMFKKSISKQSLIGVIVGLLVAWGMFLRYETLDKRPLWGDENFQLIHSRGDFKPVWQRFSYGDNTCFPGDYLLTYFFVQHSGENKWKLATPHIAATLLGFWILYLIAKKYFRTPAGYLTAFTVMVFNRELIFHAFELRPYAVLPTLALATFYFTGELKERMALLSINKKILWGIYFAVVILFHAYGILITGVSILYHFFSLSKEDPKRGLLWAYVKYFCLVFAGIFPVWLWYALGNPLNVVNPHSNVFYYIPHPFDYPAGFLKSILGNLLGNKVLYILSLGVLGSFVVVSSQRKTLLGFLLVMIVLPIQLILLVDVKNYYLFIQRQFVWVIPFFAIFLGLAWDSLFIVLGKKDRGVF